MNRRVEALTNLVPEDVAETPSSLSFDDAFSLHYRTVYRTARAIINDAFLAEDIVQEVFLRLYHHFRRVPKDELLRAWLLRVTGNVARNMLRTKTRNATREDTFAKAVLHNSTLTPTFDAAYEQHLELAHVLHALNALREPMRSCLLLKQQGLSYREIATTLRLNEKSVGSIIARGQREFLSAYEQPGGPV